MVEELIDKYLGDNRNLKEIYIIHVSLVRDRARELAARVGHLSPDITFIEEASMLHDIGIVKTNAPKIFCSGTEPYIAHGVIGREILEREGLPKHALVAERHTGSGMTKEEIQEQKLPIPARDMLPISIEEKIICFADCFYSKDPTNLRKERTVEEIRTSLKKFGAGPVERFDALCALFKWK